VDQFSLLKTQKGLWKQATFCQADDMALSERIGVRTIAALLPNLDRQTGPRYLSLSSCLATLLLDGRLAPGSRLPSERDLALVLKLSRATVTAAYDQLGREGMLVRRRGSGSYLTLPTSVQISGPGARMAREQHGESALDLSIACLPALGNQIETAMHQAADRIGSYTIRGGYHSYGLPELRALIAERYCRRGIPTTVDNILVTNGAQHGIDLLLRLMISAGDRVLTELPTYPGALEAIRSHQARAVAVPFGPDDSWNPAAIRNTMLQTSPRLAYLIPDFHNPTGVLVDTERREQVLSAARRAGTTIVVDESFIDLDLRDPELSSPAPPAMAALDTAVISVGSLSKPLWGGLRIGWIRTEVEQVQRLAIVRARSDMSGSVIDQLVAGILLAELDQALDARRCELRLKRDALLQALRVELPSWRPTVASGGLSTWVRMDRPVATPLTQLLEQRGVLLTPGSRFALDGTLERFLRIPFALPVADLQVAVHRISETYRELPDVGQSARVERGHNSLVPA